MDAWRNELTQQFVQLNREIEQKAEILFEGLKGDMATEDCKRCQAKCYGADILRFECAHSHCFDCVNDSLERLAGYFDYQYPKLVNVFAAVLDKLFVCSVCHQVYILSRKAVGSGNMQTKDLWNRGRNAYQVDEQQTKVIKESTQVKQHFENERRPLLGRFHHSALYPFERPWRTAIDSNAALDVQREERDMEEKGFIWLEDWSFDIEHSRGNPQGWSYAFNWPRGENAEHQWLREPSMKTFVRRRLMKRSCISRQALENLANVAPASKAKRPPL